MNLPNKITISRILLIPVFAAAFYIRALPSRFIISACLFLIAAATDFLDGYIARKYNLVTNMGKFLDPIADKVLVSTALILMLTQPLVLPPVFGGICVSLILARELIVSGFRLVAAGTGLVLAADKLGKIKTVFQDLSVAVLLLSADKPFLNSAAFGKAGLWLLAVAVILTIWSGLSYIIKNKEVFKKG